MSAYTSMLQDLARTAKQVSDLSLEIEALQYEADHPFMSSETDDGPRGLVTITHNKMHFSIPANIVLDRARLHLADTEASLRNIFKAIEGAISARAAE
jgi:hypothetical protein